MNRALVVFPLFLAACGGGTWSNQDLEFQAALPTKRSLESTLPSTSESQRGLAQRRQGLGPNPELGQPSQLYGDTQRASDEFNGALDHLLAVIEAVRSLPPSRREGDTRRIWGPYPSRENPGFDARLVMDREGAQFRYRVEMRRSPSGEWFSLLDGEFLASSGIRKGVGALVFSAARARANGIFDDAVRTLEQLDVTYNTDSAPTVVQMLALMEGGKTIAYENRRREDGSGSIRFEMRADLSQPQDGIVETVAVRSAWVPSGEGRGTWQIRSTSGGIPIGARQDECWDDAFATQWFRRDWEGRTSGTPSDVCTSLTAALE